MKDGPEVRLHAADVGRGLHVPALSGMRMSVHDLKRDALKSGAEPLYVRLAQLLREPILSKHVAPGEYLPGEKELAAYFHVSRDTVRHAVSELTKEGLVEVNRGFGVVVVDRQIEAPIVGLSGFVEDMQALGLVPTARVVSVRTITADERTTQELRLPPEAEVVEIRRVRLANDVPISYDITWLPRWIGDKIAGEDLTSEPIFSLLEKKYDIPLLEADYRISAGNADAETSRALQVDENSRILEIERTSYCKDGPIDYERLLFCADRLKFRMRLKRARP